MSKTIYLLDSNILITPYRRYYQFSFCPGFWDFLHQQFVKKESMSITKVYDEIARNTDDLSTWLKTKLDKKLFIDTARDADVVDKYAQVSEWVLKNSQYYEPAKRDFLQVEEADPWICAYAAVYGITVVTEEVSQPNARSKISLVDVMKAFNVPYINVFDYLEAQQAKFVLSQ